MAHFGATPGIRGVAILDNSGGTASLGAMVRNLLLIALIALLAAGPAVPAAAHVFFYQKLGDWTVLCWRDLASDTPACRLSAPPLALSGTGRQNALVVQEHSRERFRIAVEIVDKTMPGLPLFLRIDGNAVHESAIARRQGGWDGATAETILKQLLEGENAVYRVQTAPLGLPRDTLVGLAGFRRALAIYRHLLRANGILANTPSP